jgi:hypothetical protein
MLEAGRTYLAPAQQKSVTGACETASTSTFALHDHRRKLPAQSLTKMDDVSFPNADPPRTASWTIESLARVGPNEKGLHL